MKPETKISRLKNEFFKCLSGRKRKYEFIEIAAWIYKVERANYCYTLEAMKIEINRLIYLVSAKKYDAFVVRFVCVNEDTRHTECTIPPLKKLLDCLGETYGYRLEKIHEDLSDSPVMIKRITKSESILKEM